MSDFESEQETISDLRVGYYLSVMVAILDLLVVAVSFYAAWSAQSTWMQFLAIFVGVVALLAFVLSIILIRKNHRQLGEAFARAESRSLSARGGAGSVKSDIAVAGSYFSYGGVRVAGSGVSNTGQKVPDPDPPACA
ncbi:hypothetical protein SAMN05421853_11569 [Roseivivax halotolerans]|uniref:Uncharacterized protein n=1 Tax=Roseivivax halotolerans TaxID=93684 RepID=A0A1I6A725_9RHOB|nr:hypothetical protein [Roseivivax halotolerans]SFQ64458.1 hypothetical protein SAMN05421853_11569 [Roseivivax halotolerans]